MFKNFVVLKLCQSILYFADVPCFGILYMGFLARLLLCSSSYQVCKTQIQQPNFISFRSKKAAT